MLRTFDDIKDRIDSIDIVDVSTNEHIRPHTTEMPDGTVSITFDAKMLDELGTVQKLNTELHPYTITCWEAVHSDNYGTRYTYILRTDGKKCIKSDGTCGRKRGIREKLRSIFN